MIDFELAQIALENLGENYLVLLWGMLPVLIALLIIGFIIGLYDLILWFNIWYNHNK